MRHLACLATLAIPTSGCGNGVGAPPPHAATAPSDSVQAEAPRGPLDSLLAGGEARYYDGDYDGARALWGEVLRRATPAEPAAEPSALMWLGLAAWKQSDYAEARRLGERALALKLARGLSADLSRSYNALGLVAWHSGRLIDAASLFDSAMATAARLHDDLGVNRAAGNLGLVQSDLGELPAARASFIAMRDAARRAGDPRIEGNATTNLGMLLVQQGAARAALAELAEARRLYALADYPAGHQNALGQLAAAYAELGDIRRALTALDSALAIARAQQLPEDETSNLQLMGELHASVGDLERALRYFNAALGLALQSGLPRHEGTARRSLAAVQARQGDLPRARASATAGLRAHRTAGARVEELSDLLLLAEIEQAAGRPAEADAYLRAARRLSAALGGPVAHVTTALSEARLAERAGHDRRVLAVLGLDSAQLARVGAGAAWEVHALRARAFARMGALDSAIGSGYTAVRAVEMVRAGIGGGELRSLYSTDRAAAYGDLATALLRRGRPEDAFRVADAARGRALLEHLLANGGDAAEPGGSAGLDAARQSEVLLRRIDVLAARLADDDAEAGGERGGADAGSAELARRLAEARSEYELRLVQLAQQHPRDAALLAPGTDTAGETSPGPGVADVRAALQPGEVLVQYLVTADRLLSFVLTRAGMRALESPIGAADLAGRVRLARELIARPRASAAEAAPVLSALDDILVAPLRRRGLLRGVTRLIVVPHQGLSYLPFAALRDRTTGRYLAQDLAVLYLPSAASLPVLRATAPRGGGPGGALRAVAFAPLPKLLPATRGEAGQLRRYARYARVIVGRRATEQRLRSALRDGRQVHVASHGVMNAANPMFSRIVLAPGSEVAPADDGRLEVHELLGLDIQSNLVFLSGCETGVGGGWYTDFSRREDYATLAQAFLYAGARNVIATLWTIEDASAAAFARSFYRQLRRLPPAEALAAAQRGLLRDPRYAHPYYWGAHTLHGTGSLQALDVGDAALLSHSALAR